jgi:hypothetical protein
MVLRRTGFSDPILLPPSNHKDPTTSPVIWADVMAQIAAAYAAPFDPTLWPSLKL